MSEITTERLKEIEKLANKAVGSLLSADIIDLIAEIKSCWTKLKAYEDKIGDLEDLALENFSGVDDLVAEKFRLKTELTLARAAAIQWVAYDGTMKTLPIQGRRVLLERLLTRHLNISIMRHRRSWGL